MLLKVNHIYGLWLVVGLRGGYNEQGTLLDKGALLTQIKNYR